MHTLSWIRYQKQPPGHGLWVTLTLVTSRTLSWVRLTEAPTYLDLVPEFGVSNLTLFQGIEVGSEGLFLASRLGVLTLRIPCLLGWELWLGSLRSLFGLRVREHTVTSIGWWYCPPTISILDSRVGSSFRRMSRVSFTRSAEGFDLVLVRPWGCGITQWIHWLEKRTSYSHPNPCRYVLFLLQFWSWGQLSDHNTETYGLGSFI